MGEAEGQRRRVKRAAKLRKGMVKKGFKFPLPVECVCECVCVVCMYCKGVR